MESTFSRWMKTAEEPVTSISTRMEKRLSSSSSAITIRDGTGKQILINREGKELVAEYEYEYDDMVNWILCKGKTSEDPSIVGERTRRYYEE